MQTHIRGHARGIEIGIGFELDAQDIRDQEIAASGYLPINRDSSDERIQLLETWQCPNCGHENWARITLVGTQVAAIEAIELDRVALAEAQFITDNCFILASQLSGTPGSDFVEGKLSPVRVLLEKLP
jgi:hypothetical protein